MAIPRTFTLRTAILAMALAAAVCGLVGVQVNRARRMWIAVASVHAHGGYVVYDYQRNDPGDLWLDSRRRHDSFADRYWNPPRVVEVWYSLEHDKTTRPNVVCLHDLPALTVLRIDGKLDEQEAEMLPRLQQVKELRIHRVRLSPRAMDSVGGVGSLRRLVLKETWIDDAALSKLAGLSNLEELDLSYTETTGVTLRLLACRARLKRLSLEDAVVTDEGMASLAAMYSLQQLDLANNVQITDRGLAHLEKLNSLREVDLTNCRRLTAEGLANLHQASPDLKITGP